MRLCPPSYTLRGSDELNITKTFPFIWTFSFNSLSLIALEMVENTAAGLGPNVNTQSTVNGNMAGGVAYRLGPYVNTHKTAPIGLGPRVNTHHLILELRYILPSLLAIILVIVWSWFWRLIHLKNKTSFVREWGGYSTLIHPPCYMDLSWLPILLLRLVDALFDSQNRWIHNLQDEL